jgi:hypothetical protein
MPRPRHVSENNRMRRNRAFIATPAAAVLPINMEEHEWLTIQGNKGLGGQTLPKEVRQHLLEVTGLYASSRQTAESTRPLREILHRLEKWRGQTNNLRATIWRNGTTREPKTLRSLHLFHHEDDWNTDIEEVQEQLLCSSWDDRELHYPLALLDRILNGAVLMTHLVEKKLSDDANESDGRRLWFLWAALVFSIITNAGIKVKHPKRDNLLPGPLHLLAKLQLKLPGELQLRKILSGSEMKPSDISETFRKGAVIAYKIRTGNPTQFMEQMLDRWVRGDFRRNSDMVDAKFLARFDRLTRI